MPDDTIRVSDLTTNAELNLYFVLWVDIVGYSPLGIKKAVEAVTELDRAVKNCPTYVAAHNDGQVIEISTGDGFGLVFRHDALNPVRCALELREEIRRTSKIRLRMGIHIGPAETRTTNLAGNLDVHGDAVNTAARIISLANPGEILVSGQAHEILRHVEAVEGMFEEAGTHFVKHGQSITVFRLLEKRPAPHVPNWIEKRELSLASKIVERNKDSGRALASAPVIAKRLAEIRRDAFLGVLILAVALVLSVPIETSRPGHDVKQWAYEKLQSNLLSPAGPVPVVVVDIGRKLDKDDAGTTDLNALKEVLDGVEEQGPAAVAIDIDFGYLPIAKRWLDDDDIVVGAAYEYSKKGKPVYLTVKRMLYRQDPQQWLGAEEYQGMVVHPFFTDSEVVAGPTTLARWIVLGKNKIPSLVERLVTHYSPLRKPDNEPPQFLKGAVSQYAEPETKLEDLTFSNGEGGSVKQPSEVLRQSFYLNFSALDKIKAQTIHAETKADVTADPRKASLLKDAMVIIGSVDPERDGWVRPDTHVREAGIYLHAVGAYTAAKAPLYEFKPWARTILNTVTLLVILGSVLVVRLAYVARIPTVRGGALSVFFTLCMAGLTYALGAWLVRSYSIFWTDFLLSACLILFHPRFEHEIVRAWKTARALLNRGWNAIVFRSARSEG